MGNSQLQVEFILPPYLPRVFIGGCGSKDREHYFPEVETYAAHTHVCEQDADQGLVCFAAERDFFDSVTRWHEYAHILTIGISEFKCPHNHRVFMKDFITLQQNGHDKPWREMMERLGQYVPARYFDDEEELEEYTTRRIKEILGARR